jgi:hypothetical protein
MPETADHAYTILEDHGGEFGWGPAAVAMPLFPPHPIIYTEDSPHVLEMLRSACRLLSQTTGRPTKLVRYTQREDVYVAGINNQEGSAP